MKIRIITTSLLLLAASLTFAQSHKASYERQVRMVGPAGVGVETIIDKWEAAEPNNPEVQIARFSYCFNKSRSSSVEPMGKPKYLGAEPVVTLKDSLGHDVYFYEIDFFDDALFAQSQQAIDKAIRLVPTELGYRVDKINSLLLYEAESPDMAREEIIKAIDYNYYKKPKWTLRGESIDQDVFIQAVQEYCSTLFKYGSEGGYYAFLTISEKMHKILPKSTVFMNNLGSYYLVGANAPRIALRWYNKVLKIKPDDYIAARNCVLLARNEKNIKLEKKYLPYLIKATTDEVERRGYEIRLESLGKK